VPNAVPEVGDTHYNDAWCSWGYWNGYWWVRGFETEGLAQEMSEYLTKEVKGEAEDEA